jgi:hypothetical protein
MSFSICENICVSVAIRPGSIPDAAVFFKLFRVLADNPSGVDLNFEACAAALATRAVCRQKLILRARAMLHRGWLLRAPEPSQPIVAR